MFRSTMGWLALGLVGLAGTAWAGDEVRRPAVYQGTLHALSVGELVECAGPVLQTRLTYLAMPGICDDLGARPCAGRLVALMERCAQDNAALAAGSLSGGYSRSVVRLCLDDVAPGAGEGVCGARNQVARGTWIGAGRSTVGAAALEATAVLTLRQTRLITLDGRRAALPPGRQLQHFTLQRSEPGPDSCAAPAQAGCGIIGVGVAVGPPPTTGGSGRAAGVRLRRLHVVSAPGVPPRATAPGALGRQCGPGGRSGRAGDDRPVQRDVHDVR